MKRPHIQRYPLNSWADTAYDNAKEWDYHDAKHRDRRQAQHMPQADVAEWGERPAHKTKKNAIRRSAGLYAS